MYTVTLVMTIKLTGMKLDDTKAGHEEHYRLLLVHRQTVHVVTLLVLVKQYIQIRYIINIVLIPSNFIVLLWPNKNYADIKLV